MNPLTQVGLIVLKCGPKNSGPFIQNSGPLLFEGGSSEPPEPPLGTGLHSIKYDYYYYYQHFVWH